MEKLIISLVIILMAIFTFIVSVVKAETIEVQVTAEVKETKLYYFTADWCRVCKLQLPIIKILKNRGINFEIIQEDNPLTRKYKITKWPTIIIKTNDAVIRLEGLQSLRKLTRTIKILMLLDNDLLEIDWR